MHENFIYIDYLYKFIHLVLNTCIFTKKKVHAFSIKRKKKIQFM